MTSNDVVRSSVYGFASMLFALTATYFAVLMAGALGSNIGFSLTLRLGTMFFPFSNTRPDIPSVVSWPLNAAFWFIVAFVVGLLGGTPTRRGRIALIAFAAVLAAGFAVETFLGWMGYPRYVYIDL